MKLEKILSSEIEQESVVLLRLDPGRVRIWEGNARVYDRLTEEQTRELIDSIDMVGQQMPVLVRPVHGNADVDHELIAGSRRHFAVSWLRAHLHADVWLLAQVSNLRDEEAFSFSDAENRAREDVTDLERARNYVWALEAIYNGSLGAMAASMAISKGWLSKMISVGKIPDEVIAAFDSPSEVKVKPCYPLAQALSDKRRAPRILELAAAIAKGQARCRELGQPIVSAPQVLEQLLEKPIKMPVKIWRSQRCGSPALTLESSNYRGLSVRVHAHSGATSDELVAAFRELLGHLDAEK